MSNQTKLVWAKVQGYPWWPGVVIKKQDELAYIKNKKTFHRIRFISDNSW